MPGKTEQQSFVALFHDARLKHVIAKLNVHGTVALLKHDLLSLQQASLAGWSNGCRSSGRVMRMDHRGTITKRACDFYADDLGVAVQLGYVTSKLYMHGAYALHRHHLLLLQQRFLLHKKRT